MPEHTFHTPVPPELHVEIGRGSVRVEAGDTRETHVHVTGERAEEVRVEQDGDRVVVHAPRSAVGFLGGERDVQVHVTTPTETRLVARLGSADLTTTGLLGRCGVKTGSGDVALDEVGDHSGVQTGSGDLSVARAHGELRLQSGSGDVRLQAADGEVSVSTGSGDVRIVEVASPLQVKTGSGDLVLARSAADTEFRTGSGDLRVERAERGRLTVACASGDVAVGVPDGLPVWTDLRTLSGRIRSSLPAAGEPAPGQDHLELRATTASGDITLTVA